MSRPGFAVRRAASVFLFAAIACGCLSVTVALAAENASVQKFTLPDIYGRNQSLDSLADKQLVVVAFLGTECPLARLYAARMQEMSDAYAARGVAFVGVDANPQDSLTDMTAFARQYGWKFPFLKDRDQSVAEQFGTLRNPEVFVLDGERKVRYRGRIDDQYGLGSSSGYARPEIKRRDLGIALDELLAGKEVSQPVTQVTGCALSRKSKAAPSGQVTYTKNIAGLLQEKCVSCHRPGQVGPFALMEYEEVAGWGEMIKEVVNEGRMPPWAASPKYGHFSNDARLSDAEKKLINSWVDNGCPQGDLADLPPAKKWVEGWAIGEPHQILRMEKAYTVPAEGVIPYQAFVVDPGWTEDKWIQRAEVLPSARGVVHHIIASILPPGARYMRGGEDGEGGGGSGRASGADGSSGSSDQQARARRLRARANPAALGDDFGGSKLTSYVPGRPPTAYDDGIAMLAKAGSKIVFQMHYTPNGKEVEDQSYIGMIFADPKTVKKRAHVMGASAMDIQIPPHADNHKITSEMPIHTDQLLLSMSPHMHLRGKSFRYEAVSPDGSREILVDVPKYDFNWQLTYELAEPKLLKAGSKLECTAFYDNSENNVANPDPTKTITWGPQTWDEMMIGYYAVVTVEDDAHRPADKSKFAQPADVEASPE